MFRDSYACERSIYQYILRIRIMDILHIFLGASGGVMVSKLDKQTYTSEFESHWVPLSYGLVPHLSKKLSKFPSYTFSYFFFPRMQ